MSTMQTDLIIALINILAAIPDSQENGVPIERVVYAINQLFETKQIQRKYQLSEIFNVLCISVESLHIFKFHHINHNDIYFSLQGPKEEMLQRCNEIKPLQHEPIPEFVPPPPIDLLHYQNLMNEMESSLRKQATQASHNEELQKQKALLREQIDILSTPAGKKGGKLQ